MATIAARPRDVIDLITDEMAFGVDRAVAYWMSQIDSTLRDPRLTSLGRLNAIKRIVEHYKDLTGKSDLAVPTA